MYVIGGGRLFTFWSELLYLEDGAAAGAACDTGIRTALGCGICGSCGREKLAEFILAVPLLRAKAAALPKATGHGLKAA